MINKIIETCQNFNSAIENRNNLTDEEERIIAYHNINLAKAIIEDMDSHNAKCIAKIILGFVE